LLNRLKPKSEFSKNVLTLMTGTTIAQAIPIAISPILTRIYTPEDFGVFALFIAIVAILGSIANGRYELAIMLPKKDEDAINIFALGFIINVVLSIFLLLIVILFHSYIINLLNNKEISPWLYFIPFSIFLMGCFNLLNYYNNRLKNYKDLSKTNVYKSIAMAITQLSIGFVKQGAMGLISGQIISQLVSNTKLLKNIVKDKILLSKITKVQMIELAKRYKDFPKYSVVSTLFNSGSNIGMPVIINIFFSTSVVGFYFFANRIVRLPLGLVFSSFSQVFYQKAAQLYNTDKYALYKLTIKTQYKIGILLIPILITISIISPYVFSIIFGEKWFIAGEYVKYFAVFVFFNSLYSPISSLDDILNKQRVLMFFNFSLVFSQIIVMKICVDLFNFDFKFTILFVSIVGSIHFLLLNNYIIKQLIRK
jgi:O-antigen/teichoic acid export membrane protein